jgi:hypothetical protein
LTSGCVISSPTWDYVPSSTEAAIPFQAWTTSNETPVTLECATDTEAHGSPVNGDASYIHVADLQTADTGSLDASGYVVYSVSGMHALPSRCWKFFGDYGYWQANLRVTQVIDGEMHSFSSFDNAGLECLGRENSKAGSWFGFTDKCEMRYAGKTDKIPYVVLRVGPPSAPVVQ